MSCTKRDRVLLVDRRRSRGPIRHGLCDRHVTRDGGLLLPGVINVLRSLPFHNQGGWYIERIVLHSLAQILYYYKHRHRNS